MAPRQAEEARRLQADQGQEAEEVMSKGGGLRAGRPSMLLFYVWFAGILIE